MLSSASTSSPAGMRCAATGTKGSAAEFKTSRRSSMASCTVSLNKEEWSMYMALYVDSAFLNSIMEVARTVPLAGVTTNPSILLAAQSQGQMLSPLEVLHALLARVEGHIFMQPGATEEEEMYRQAHSYIETDPMRVIPKIPMTHV